MEEGGEFVIVSIVRLQTGLRPVGRCEPQEGEALEDLLIQCSKRSPITPLAFGEDKIAQGGSLVDLLAQDLQDLNVDVLLDPSGVHPGDAVPGCLTMLSERAQRFHRPRIPER